VRALVATCAALLLASATASADGGEDLQCRESSAPKYPDSSFPLAYSTPRYFELGLEVRYLGDSVPVQSSIAPAAIVGAAWSDHWARLGVRVGGAFGAWGEDGRGPAALLLGVRGAFDIHRFMSGLVALHIPVNTDVLLLSAHGDAVVRFDPVGLGVDVARAVSVDATFDLGISPATPFASGSPLAYGFGIGVTVDFCAFWGACAKSPQTTTDTDLTPDFYAQATRAAQSIPHDELCSAVDAAMDPSKYHATSKHDEIHEFLRGVSDNLRTASSKAALAVLERTHDDYRKQLTDSRQAVTNDTRDGRAVLHRCTYAPYPVEIRRVFGCDCSK
jgi:hypothetical protein